MPDLREYTGTAKPTTLSGAISAAATSIAVADGTGYPTGSVGPFVITINTGNASEEKVLCSSRTGNTLTVATGGRGWDGTTASDHENAESVAHTFSATDAREANAHVSNTGNPHGASGARVHRTTSQTIPNAAFTSVLFTAEVSDTSGFHDNATNPSRLTVPAGLGGRYRVDGNAYFTGNAIGARAIRILKNGATEIALAQTGGQSADDQTLQISDVLVLAAGDYVEIQVYQASGASLDLRGFGGQHMNYASIERLGA